MSRIGERKLAIPTGVTVSVNNNKVVVKGPKGELSLEISKLINVVVEDSIVACKIPDEFIEEWKKLKANEDSE